MRKVSSFFTLILSIFGFVTPYAKGSGEELLKAYNYKISKKEFPEVKPGSQDF